MATDYDTPRKTDDELSEDSLDGLFNLGNLVNLSKLVVAAFPPYPLLGSHIWPF